MNKNINLLIHIADIFAIPFFYLLVKYFENIKNKTKIEYILYIFSIIGFIADIVFTYIYFCNNNINYNL